MEASAIVAKKAGAAEEGLAKEIAEVGVSGASLFRNRRNPIIAKIEIKLHTIISFFIFWTQYLPKSFIA